MHGPCNVKFSKVWFYEGTCKEKRFILWTQHFDRRRVCNPTVWWYWSLSLTNCVCYDKSLYHERCVAHERKKNFLDWENLNSFHKRVKWNSVQRDTRFDEGRKAIAIHTFYIYHSILVKFGVRNMHVMLWRFLSSVKIGAGNAALFLWASNEIMLTAWHSGSEGRHAVLCAASPFAVCRLVVSLM